MICGNCGFENRHDMKFCGMCGRPLGRTCPACGFVNPPEHRFCGKCGTRLAEVTTPVSASPLQTAPPAPSPSLEQRVAVPPAPAVSDVEPPGVSRAEPPTLEGERRPATVVVVDVVHSTELLERLGTEVWVETMNRVLQILERQIYRFGGEVDQFRGDGLVAFFGARIAHEDDPERAIHASLAMHRAVERYAAELNGREAIDLQLRVGVNTGEVVVANIGDRRRHSEDTAMGEAVALAARLESAAEPGTVLASENTYRLAESHFEWLPLGEISLKGIRQPISIYRPLAPPVETDPTSRLHTYGLSIPLVGRDAEFQALKHSVEDLFVGRGGIAVVTAEKGIGKSFLVSEVRQHFSRQSALLAEAHERDVSQRASLSWLTGRCRSYDQTWPYSMWLSLYRNWLGIRRGESKEETRDRLQRQAEALWGEQLTENYAYLAALLSLPLEDAYAEKIKHLDAEALREQVFLTVRRWVEAIARRGPLVLAFADVHWADTASLELLKYCLPECDHEALLWLIVSRPDRMSPFRGFRHHIETEYPHRLTSLNLPPLTTALSGEFLDQLVGIDTLPEETRTLVLNKAEGNPYYISELVRALIDQGVLVREAGTDRWRATRAVTSLDLPGSLQTLLLSRIDGLSAEERQVLQMAAVIGPVFWQSALKALVGDATRLRKHLTGLQRADLIEERGRLPDLGREYAFKSNLVRDAAYEGLLSAQRATYHREVAEHLARYLNEGALPDYYGVLAYHFRHAGARRKELFYTLSAAEQAKRVYANSEALERYTRALDLLAEMAAHAPDESALYAIRTQRFEVLNGRREVNYLIGELDAGQADARALLQLAQQMEEDPTWMIDALLQQPGVASWQTREELEAGISMAQEALRLARQLGDRRREMQGLLAMSRQRLFLNDPAWQEIGEQALELAQQLGDRRSEALLLTEMGTAYGWSDQPQRGMAYLEAALPLSRALDDKITEVHVLSQFALQAERSGDYYRLLTEYHEERLRISRRINYRQGESDALISCGQTQTIYLGDYASGLALLNEGQRIRDSIVGRSFGIHAELAVVLRIVQVFAMQAKYGEALEALEAVHRVDEQEAHPIVRAGRHLVTAILYNALGDEEHLRQALGLAAQVGRMVDDNQVSRQFAIAAACESAAAHLHLAELLTEQEERPVDAYGQPETQSQHHLHRALECSQDALDVYQSFGFVQIIECVSEEILFRHSLALNASGREAEAAEYLRRAYDEMMRKHDLIPPDSHCRHTFLENIPLHRHIRAAYITMSA